MATAEEIIARSPGLKRNVLSRYGKKWHLRENYQMTQEERDKLLDELYGEEDGKERQDAEDDARI